MSSKSVKLNLASRQLISQVLNALDKPDITAARMARSVWQSVKVRDAQRSVEEQNKNREEEALEKHEQAEPLTWEALNDTERLPFDIDVTSLKWLQEQLEKHVWGKMYTQDGKEIKLPMPIGMLVAIADLADALLEAV